MAIALGVAATGVGAPALFIAHEGRLLPQNSMRHSRITAAFSGTRYSRNVLEFQATFAIRRNACTFRCGARTRTRIEETIVQACTYTDLVRLKKGLIASLNTRDFLKVSLGSTGHIMQLVLPFLLFAMPCNCDALPLEAFDMPTFQNQETFVRKDIAVLDKIPTTENPSRSLTQCAPVCEESYGFLPCSVNTGGNLFLMVTYGFSLLLSAKFIAEGSELLLEVMNPGLLGGLLLPIVGAVPDAVLILASGVGGTIEEAQTQVMVGIGVLAGSTTLILTLAWAASLFAGRCDLSAIDGTAQDQVLTRRFNLLQTGVTTDMQTRWGAWIMMASMLPLVCAQLPVLDGHPGEGPEAALIGSVISFIGLFAYCSYQVLFPWLQQKRIEEARFKFLKTRVLQQVSSYSKTSRILTDEGFGFVPEELGRVFKYFDKNGDGRIEKDELKGLIVGLGIDQVHSGDLVDNWLREFDLDEDNMIAEHEFVEGLSKWAAQVAKVKTSRRLQQLESSYGSSFWATKSEEAEKVLQLLEQSADDNTEENASGESSRKLYSQAILYLVSGALLAAVFADPLVNSIEGFARGAQIPSFYVAFVVTPLASNASELFSSVTFAMKKRKQSISLTFSQIYGAATMNNTLCLGIFLGLVYIRGLTWDFSSEVTAILITTFSVGILGVSRTTFPSWVSIPVLALYPLSIAIIAFLDNILGWH